MEFIDTFLLWCNENFLHLKPVEDFVFELEGIEGNFLLIQPKETGKILDKDCCFVLDNDELALLNSEKIANIIFEFGGRFYYCKPKQYENDGEVGYEADFQDFKYIGKNTTQLDLPFIHLGIHSEYELLNGAHHAKLWAQKAEFLNQVAIGICDKDTLAGVLSMQLECSKKKIKSIIGETISVAINYDPKKSVQNISELKLYVMNDEGWQNLLQINKAINVDFDGFIPEEVLLKEVRKGLIAVISTNHHLNSTIGSKAAEVVINEYGNKFEHLYWQIDTVEFYDNKIDIDHLNKLKRYFDEHQHLVEPVMINDSYYLDKEMYPLKERMNTIDHKAYPYSEDQYFKNIDEVHNEFSKLFSDTDKYFDLLMRMTENTIKIAGLCSFEINVGEYKLPKYEFVEGMSNEDFLTERISDGFTKKIRKYNDDVELLKVYNERVKIEMKVIYDAGFVDYFLILWDVVAWAKENGIYVGTGRGSVCGSLLAYLLDITTVDPIKHDLLFERFMNVARLSGERAKSADAMPDVDLDFESSNRDMVKAYIYYRFGSMYTCSIGSYTRLKLKAGIKDFARVKGLEFGYVNFVTKEIDNQIEYTFQDLIKYALNGEKQGLYDFIQRNPDIVHCIKFSLGQARSASIHASAVMIVPKLDKNGKKMDIFDWLPIRKIDGVLISEWEGKYCERAGFLKEDILSLSQLDKFKKIIQLIERNHGKKIILEEIPLDDKKTYEQFQKGWNEDVFQFGSMGLKSYSRHVKPDCIEDLVAMNALYRPGAMSSNAHSDFAAIKHHKKKPQYDYGMEEITKNTHGLFVYQEQIMQAVTVGGLSLVEADEVRTTIKHFDKVALHKFKDKFVKGYSELLINSADKSADNALQISEIVWQKLMAFSGYGFNKSHSVAYTLIGYYSQWFKVNFPLEFWTASLNFTSYEKEIPKRLSEIRKLRQSSTQGLTVKPPSVNKSNFDFDCDKETKTIYWSLMKIKGLGAETVRKIIHERTQRGDFYSYEEFVKRVLKKDVNKKHVTILILSGAFDEIEGIDEPLQRIEILKKHYERLDEELPAEYKTSLVHKSYFWILKQREFIGYGDVDYRTLLMANIKTKKLADDYISGERFIDSKGDYKVATVCGKVIFVTDKTSKKTGKVYIRLGLLCNNDEINMMIWNNILDKKENFDFFKNSKDKFIFVTGKIKYDTYYQINLLYSYDDTRFGEI
jgi:DNA polymerase-3 subunit alpha